MSMKDDHLVGLFVPFDDPDGDHPGFYVAEFDGPTLEEAVGKAVDWRADRANHGFAPTALALRRMDSRTGDWVLLPNSDQVSGVA